MKKTTVLSAIMGMTFVGAVNAADVKLYYLPTCPHCHHARDFIGGELVYEYPSIQVEALNVSAGNNVQDFQETLQKCKYESGGVPVIVVGEKCFQGYADFMKQEFRDAVAVDLSDAEKKAGAENVKAFEADPQKFRDANPSRANAMQERVLGAEQKKNSEGSSVIYFYVLLGLLVAGLGFVLLRKGKK